MAIEIEEGDTENDCVQRVAQGGQQIVTDYFSGLTQHWINLAYGKIEPDVLAFSQLCSSWPFAKVAISKEGKR